MQGKARLVGGRKREGEGKCIGDYVFIYFSFSFFDLWFEVEGGKRKERTKGGKEKGEGESKYIAFLFSFPSFG